MSDEGLTPEEEFEGADELDEDLEVEFPSEAGAEVEDDDLTVAPEDPAWEMPLEVDESDEEGLS